MIALILSFIAGAANGYMDGLNFHPSKYKFFLKRSEFWIIQRSWDNKWKNGDKEQGEAFWGSSRWFVFLTDGWHFLQFVMWQSLFFAIVFYNPLFGEWISISNEALNYTLIHLVDFLILRGLCGLGFAITYK